MALTLTESETTVSRCRARHSSIKKQSPQSVLNLLVLFQNQLFVRRSFGKASTWSLPSKDPFYFLGHAFSKDCIYGSVTVAVLLFMHGSKDREYVLNLCNLCRTTAMMGSTK